MYTDETLQNRIKVYPNKEAIKQMRIKNSCYNTCWENTHVQNLTVPGEIQNITQNTQLKNTDDSNAGLYYLLLIVLMLADGNDSDGTLFTLILSTMFLY